MIGQLAAVFNIAVCIGIPLGALVWLALRRRTGVKVFLLGAAGFFVSQMLVRQPLLALLGQTDGYRLFTAAHPVAQALFLALTAGLAEETARYLVFCLLARNKQPERGTPLWYGLGHGGLEAVLVGLNSVVLLGGCAGNAGRRGRERGPGRGGAHRRHDGAGGPLLRGVLRPAAQGLSAVGHFAARPV